jgi:hypothetical protein
MDQAAWRRCFVKAAALKALLPGKYLQGYLFLLMV